ncbi:hypothetical protein [Aquamicrobium soli]|uniref:Uncharacterized protein n=1 Tax=Aquamicrobium soli TaxID=1811518 RepID=A0ABV7K651_9HYPH
MTDAEHEKAEQHGNGAPVVAHDKGQSQQCDGAQDEARSANLARREPLIEAHDQQRCKEDGVKVHRADATEVVNPSASLSACNACDGLS